MIFSGMDSHLAGLGVMGVLVIVSDDAPRAGELPSWPVVPRPTLLDDTRYTAGEM